jgi:hypothetical protein
MLRTMTQHVKERGEQATAFAVGYFASKALYGDNPAYNTMAGARRIAARDGCSMLGDCTPIPTHTRSRKHAHPNEHVDKRIHPQCLPFSTIPMDLPLPLTPRLSFHPFVHPPILEHLAIFHPARKLARAHTQHLPLLATSSALVAFSTVG